MSWLFKQVWVWILIAFLLGLILTWIYVVHKASRTVEAPDERQRTPGEALTGADEEPDEPQRAAETTASDERPQPEAEGTEPDRPEESDQPEPSTVEQPTGTTAPATSRDDQPEAAGAAAAAEARARADERPAAPQPAENEVVHDGAPKEEPAEPVVTSSHTPATSPDDPHGKEQTSMGATDVSPSIIHDDDNETIGEMTTPADQTPTVGKAETTSPAAGQVGTVAADDAAVAKASAEDAPAEDEPAATDDASAEDAAVQRFGPGAASTLPDGSAPPGHPIKGNVDSMLFHTKDSPRYAATSPGVWFADEASATAAGFAHWDRTKRGTTPSHLAHAASDEAAPPQPAAEDAPVEAPAQAVEDKPVETQPPTVEDEPAETEVAADQPTSEEEPTTEETDDEPVDEDDPITAQFGSGAASPRADGSAPSLSYTIKGDADTMTFHTEDSPRFDETEAEIWFRDEASAKAAGFLHWDRSRR